MDTANLLRISYHSDLHLERSMIQIDTSRADVVVLAGDILETERATLARQNTVIDMIARKLVPEDRIPVIFVPGNHDMVGNRWRDAIEIWKSISEQRYDGRIHILVNEKVAIKSVQFLGTPLWTDFNVQGTQATSMKAAKYGICDFSEIFKNDGRPVTPDDWVEEHRIARAFLDENLRPTEDDEKEDVVQIVVTHWCPSVIGTKGVRHLAGKDLTPYWVSNDDDLVQRATAWMFGHTHQSVDTRCGQQAGKGRLLSNARGSFPVENLAGGGWRQNAAIEVQQKNRTDLAKHAETKSPRGDLFQR